MIMYIISYLSTYTGEYTYETTCATNLIMTYEALVSQYTSCVFAPSLYRNYQLIDIMQNV